jgi:hypothetical protein
MTEMLSGLGRVSVADSHQDVNIVRDILRC